MHWEKFHTVSPATVKEFDRSNWLACTIIIENMLKQNCNELGPIDYLVLHSWTCQAQLILGSSVNSRPCSTLVPAIKTHQTAAILECEGNINPYI